MPHVAFYHNCELERLLDASLACCHCYWLIELALLLQDHQMEDSGCFVPDQNEMFHLDVCRWQDL